LFRGFLALVMIWTMVILEDLQLGYKLTLNLSITIKNNFMVLGLNKGEVIETGSSLLKLDYI
jgi:hypothetical protein